MLVTSIFSFSHNVCKRLLFQGCQKSRLCGKGLTHSQTSPGFYMSGSTSLLKTWWKKEKLLVTSNISFSHCVFYQFLEFFDTLIKSELVVCKLFQLGRVKSLSFGKGFRFNQLNKSIRQHSLLLTSM